MQRSSIELQVVGTVSYKLYTGGILVLADNRGGHPEKETQ